MVNAAYAETVPLLQNVNKTHNIPRASKTCKSLFGRTLRGLFYLICVALFLFIASYIHTERLKTALDSEKSIYSGVTIKSIVVEDLLHDGAVATVQLYLDKFLFLPVTVTSKDLAISYALNSDGKAPPKKEVLGMVDLYMYLYPGRKGIKEAKATMRRLNLESASQMVSYLKTHSSAHGLPSFYIQGSLQISVLGRRMEKVIEDDITKMIFNDEAVGGAKNCVYNFRIAVFSKASDQFGDQVVMFLSIPNATIVSLRDNKLSLEASFYLEGYDDPLADIRLSKDSLRLNSPCYEVRSNLSGEPVKGFDVLKMDTKLAKELLKTSKDGYFEYKMKNVRVSHTSIESTMMWLNAVLSNFEYKGKGKISTYMNLSQGL